MVEKICNVLTQKIRKAMPEVDDERAEVINYGLQNIVGEIPKIFIIFIVGYLLNIFKLTLITFLIIQPYRAFSGGVHLKTHIGCIISTNLLYSGIPFVSQYILLEPIFIKYILIAAVWIFGMIMIKLYAPADTENVPILQKKERRKKQILSYIIFTITLAFAIVIKDSTISNIIILGMFVQTIMITKFIYKISNNKYGYEVHLKEQIN